MFNYKQNDFKHFYLKLANCFEFFLQQTKEKLLFRKLELILYKP